ncbi:MAG: hypothetical protein B6U69_03200 [Thermofilum sp. ex4484_15]|nr:MAG: hypothetical protein B6U69_03200 [Thermofilum sp. ex4484_15]
MYHVDLPMSSEMELQELFKRLNELRRAIEEIKASGRLDTVAFLTLCNALSSIYEGYIGLLKLLYKLNNILLGFSENFDELVEELIGYLPALRGTALKRKAGKIREQVSELNAQFENYKCLLKSV